MVPARFPLKLGGLGRIGGFKSERERERKRGIHIFKHIYICINKYNIYIYI